MISRYEPNARIFGVSLEQDLLFASKLWGAKRREKFIKMILKSYEKNF